jgi:hypothetical protein
MAVQGGQLLLTVDGTTIEANSGSKGGGINRNRQWLSVANGTNNNRVERYDGQSTISPTADFPLTAASMAVCTSWGLGATLSFPSTGIAITYNYPGFGESYTNCFANTATISVTENGVYNAQLSWWSTDAPTGTGGSTGSVASPQHIFWKDTTTFTTPGGDFSTALKSFSVTVNQNAVPDTSIRGDGYSMPLGYGPGPVEVTFSLGLRKSSSANFNLAVAACLTDGDIVLGASPFCPPSGGGSSPTLSLTLHHAEFEKPDTDGNIGAVVAETFTGSCVTPSGDNPIELTVG